MSHAAPGQAENLDTEPGDRRLRRYMRRYLLDRTAWIGALVGATGSRLCSTLAGRFSMIVVVVGTALGTILGGILLNHYIPIWLKKLTKREGKASKLGELHDD